MQQLFLRQARWDDAPILAAHRELVAATLGEGEGVLAIDDTDIPEDGVESVRVAGQYCDPLAQRANCQTAVHRCPGRSRLRHRGLPPSAQHRHPALAQVL